MILPENTKSLRIAVADLNGQARGKRLPPTAAEKLFTEGARMPLSVLNVDVQGNDIEASPLVFASGDQDGVLQATNRGLVPVPWLQTPTALLPMWMFKEDGAPFLGDPRQALGSVLAGFEMSGWHPQVATELEFYLVDDSAGIAPVRSPRSGKRRAGAEIHSAKALDAFAAFFTDLYDGAKLMEIPADAAISESGPGQFEVNLLHGPAMKAADDAWLFKLLVQGTARKHGFAACFMPKPFPKEAGNGLHVHFSILDDQGVNIFDIGGPEGSELLTHAVAGCLDAMSTSTLVFAPHGPSYDRFVEGAHAPTGIAWAYENRTVALRIPGGPSKARRIEHRVAGGDANPYLLISSILGAALDGLKRRAEPPKPITGNAYDQDLPEIPRDWATAISAFEGSAVLPRELIGNFVLTKYQELAVYSELSATERLDLYVDLA